MIIIKKLTKLFFKKIYRQEKIIKYQIQIQILNKINRF
jgi:hypothetical protein